VGGHTHIGAGCAAADLSRAVPFWFTGGVIGRRARIGALLVVLFVVATWAVGVTRGRRARRAWDRPIPVVVVLVAREPPPEAAVTRLQGGIEELSRRLEAEFARHRGSATRQPFAFSLAGPVVWDGAFPLEPASAGPFDRLSHAFRLWRALGGIDAAAGVAPELYDARVYVLLEPPPAGGPRTFAEGSGAAGGEVGLVRAWADPADATLALTAAAHELLHCLGASDKYDAAGHALEPEGLADPGLSPRYPQRHAEWMVGEVPLGPGQGRLPASLAEVRIGPATAREIGWLPPSPAAPLE